MSKLRTPSDVIAALGGHDAVASLTGVGETAVYNWRHRLFPAWTYPFISAALADRSLSADPACWKWPFPAGWLDGAIQRSVKGSVKQPEGCHAVKISNVGNPTILSTD